MAIAPSHVPYCSAGPIAKSFLSACSSQQPVALDAGRLCRYAHRCKPAMIITSSSQEEALAAVRNSSAAATSSSPFKARRSSILRLPNAHDLTILKLPAVHCTFPSLVHPLYDSVKEQCDDWIAAVAQPPSAAARRFLLDCLLPLFVCRMVPKAQSELRLVHAIKTIAWLMIADDYDDSPDALGSDSATTAQRADLVMAILRKGADVMEADAHDSSFDCSFLTHAQPGFASKSVRMLKALEELWDEIRKEMPPSQKARFISTMADYFEGIKAQASFRERDSIPDVESYMEIRRQASFTIPIFILMEYAMGIELDEATFYSPRIQELHNDVLDYISLCNDIVSCPKEISIGDYFNLPFILYSLEVDAPSPWKFTTFQNAVDHVAQMTNHLNTRVIFLISTIREESKHMETFMVSPLHKYLDGLSLCMSGALTWFYESARYHQPHTHNKISL